MVDYNEKYLKYKNKYLHLKKMLGGAYDIVQAFNTHPYTEPYTHPYTEPLEQNNVINEKKIKSNDCEENKENEENEEGQYEAHLNKCGEPIQRAEKADIPDLSNENIRVLDYKKQEEIIELGKYEKLSLTEIGAGITLVTGLIVSLVMALK